MSTFKPTRNSLSIGLVACAVFVLLLGACQPAVVSPNPTPEPATADLAQLDALIQSIEVK